MALASAARAATSLSRRLSLSTAGPQGVGLRSGGGRVGWRCVGGQSGGPERGAHEVLGVEQGATKQEITAAYHRLALRWHPDRNPEDAIAEARFKEAAAAYQDLRGGGLVAARGAGPVSPERAVEDFAAAAGVSLEEAETIFRSVFGTDTLDEMAAVVERAEAIRLRAQQELLARHPGFETASQHLGVGSAGALVLRTTLRRRDGEAETHERELSPEEARELAEVGSGVARLAGLAARDMATKVAFDLGHAAAGGLLGFVSGGVQRVGELAAPWLLPLPCTGAARGAEAAASEASARETQRTSGGAEGPNSLPR